MRTLFSIKISKGRGSISWHYVKESYLQLPSPLQAVIAKRLLIGLSSVLLLMAFIFVGRNIYLILPCVLIFCLCIVSAIHLVHRCVTGDILCLSGECIEIKSSRLRGKAQTVTAELGGQQAKILLSRRHSRAQVGNTLSLYLLPDTPIYEQDNSIIITRYTAITFDSTTKN